MYIIQQHIYDMEKYPPSNETIVSRPMQWLIGSFCCLTIATGVILGTRHAFRYTSSDIKSLKYFNSKNDFTSLSYNKRNISVRELGSATPNIQKPIYSNARRKSLPANSINSAITQSSITP